MGDKLAIKRVGCSVRLQDCAEIDIKGHLHSVINVLAVIGCSEINMEVQGILEKTPGGISPQLAMYYDIASHQHRNRRDW